MYLFLSRVLLHKINLVNITSKLTWPLRKTQIFSKVILPSCSLSSQTRSFNDFVKHGGDQFQSEVTPSSSQNVTLIHKKTKKEAFILNKKHSWIKVTFWLEDGVTSLRYWSPPRFTKLIDGLRYKVTFIKASGERITAKGKEGDSLLDVIVNNDLDFDGFGACEGTLTCSTCHCILKQEDYDRLPEKPSDEELDMLDLAYELTDTSRLGCQVQLSKEFDDLEVKIPTTVNDARS